MDTKRLDLNLLMTLEALLQERNVTKAARRLHLSQPAVSAQLSRLRVLFGDPLLLPAQRGMTPTAKAIELLGPLRDSLDHIRETIASNEHFDPVKARLDVVIACTDYLQVALVQPLALALRRDAPGMRVAVRHLDIAQLETQMARGDVDLAFMTPCDAPVGLRAKPLFDERYVLIGRRNHPRLRRHMTIDAFVRLEHVVVSLRGGDFATPVDATLATLGHRRRVVLSAASFLVVPELVACSDFVALVPERLVRGRMDVRVVACPFPVDGFTVGMVWHARNHTHGGQRWLRERVAALINS